MAIQKMTLPKTVKQLYKSKERLDFNLAIQRGDDIWDADRKSLLIHTLIYGYPVPAFYSEEGEGGTLYMLDGKQRLTTIFSFLDNGFKLSPNTPPIEIDGEEIEIAGLTFAQLPEDAQDEILSFNFTFYVFKGITESERSEIFFRLNNGAPMKNIETLRVYAGEKIMSFVGEIKQTPFFSNKVMITKVMRNRYVDEELIMQIISLLVTGTDKGVGTKELRDCIGSIRGNGVPEEIQEAMRYTSVYLDEAFDGSEKFLKKSHIIGLLLMALEAQKEKIQATDFADWAEKFFNSDKAAKHSPYHDTVSRGSAKAEQIRTRLTILKSDFQQYLANTFEEHTPENNEVAATLE
jgi:hypothetical protein